MNRNTLLILFGILGLFTSSANAQILDACNDKWNESYVNQLNNIRYSSVNPTRISYNAQKSFGVAKIDYTLGTGDYHSVSQSEKLNDVNVYIGGLRNLGKIDLSGFIKYSNIHEYNKKWNSTLYLMDSNPFVLCDSLNSDMITESFELSAMGSYSISDKWKAGLSLGLLLGNLSDQTDPRPETQSSVLPIVAGVEYSLNPSWKIGLSAGIKLYNSTISYTILNPLNSHCFFLMKGMGDYYRFSSSEVSGYQRSYKGTTFTGALLLAQGTEDDSKISNFTELSFVKGNENAKDGSSSYTFYGGDYDFSGMGLNHRVMWKTNRNVLHNFTLALNYTSGEGAWRDQVKKTDSEHGNLAYYEVLSKYKVHDDNRLDANIGYRLDMLKDGQRSFFAAINGGLSNTVRKHYISEGSVEQKINTCFTRLEMGQTFQVNNLSCDVMLHGAYYFPNENVYGNGNSRTLEEDISSVYTLLQHKYESASHALVGGKVDVSMPLSNNMNLGVYVKSDCQLYTGNKEFTDIFASDTYTTTSVGVYLNF